MSADEPCVVIPHQHGSRREHSAYKHTKLCLFSRRKAICVDRLQDVGSSKVHGIIAGTTIRPINSTFS